MLPGVGAFFLIKPVKFVKFVLPVFHGGQCITQIKNKGNFIRKNQFIKLKPDRWRKIFYIRWIIIRFLNVKPKFSWPSIMQ